MEIKSTLSHCCYRLEGYADEHKTDRTGKLSGTVNATDSVGKEVGISWLAIA